MNRAFMRAVSAGAVVLFSAFAGAITASAQPSEPAPPSNSSVDGNGVDVITGAYYPPYPSISIGSGPGSLGVTRSRGYEFIDSTFGGVASSGSTYYVVLFGQTTVWTKSGSTYSAAEGQGGTLTKDGSGDFTYTTPGGIVAFYDASHASLVPTNANEARVMTVTYPTGEQLTYAYDTLEHCDAIEKGEPGYPGCYLEYTASRTTSITSTLGYKLEYEYSSNTCCGVDWYTTDKITAKTLFTSGAWQSLTFSGNNITDADGGIYTYTRSGSDPITAVRFPGYASDNITIAYDTSDRVTSVTQFGLSTTYSYADNGSTRTTTITTPDSHDTVVTSNTSTNRVASVKNALNQTTSYTYDSAGRLLEATAPEGNYAKYAYDSRGNVTEVRNYNKSDTAFIYAFRASYPATCTNAKTCNKPTWTRDALGNQTDYTYNSTHGSVLTIKAPSAGIARPQTTFTYSSQSTYTSSAWRLATAASCALTTSSTCAGSASETKVEYVYGANDRIPTSFTAKAGNNSVSSTTTISYDHQRRSTSVDGPLSGAADTVKTFYNVVGLVTGTIAPDPDGAGSLKYRATRITYNSKNQPYLTEVGTTTGNTSMASFSALQSTTVSYDTHGRPTKSTFAAGGTTYAVQMIQYRGDNGLVNCVTTRMNPGVFGSNLGACALNTTGSYGQDRITQTIYDALYRPIRVKTAVLTSAVADAVQTTYTTNGQVATVTDGEGNKTTYEYDAYDRRFKTRFPSKTAAGTSSATDYEQYTFNNNGAVTSFRNRAAQTITYTLDNLSRVTGSSGSGATTRTRTYDNLGRVTALTGGENVSYTYDALSRVKTEVQAQGTVSYAYDAAGRMTKLTWPDSFYVNYDYDVSGAVTKVRENGATSGVGVLATYEYDDLGRRTKLTYGNGNVTDYAYDGASRLTDLDHDLGGTTHDTNIDFSYNPAGQITQRVGSNDLYAYLDHWNIDATAIVNGLNQATSVDGDTVGYDSKGNVTSYDGVTYTYDAENFLTAANGYTISYDAAGRFHQRTKTGVDPRKALYAGDRMIALYKGDDTVNNYFIHGASVDEPIVRRNPGGVRRFLIKDERGSVIASTKDDGSVATDNTYDAYGRNGDTNAGRFQYTGQQWWGDFGLYYYKARWYHPELGRFMQTDPIGYGDGMNMYGYVGGDPVNFTDPTGLEQQGEICTGSHIPKKGCSDTSGGSPLTCTGDCPAPSDGSNSSTVDANNKELVGDTNNNGLCDADEICFGVYIENPYQIGGVPWFNQPWHLISGGRASSGGEYLRGLAGELAGCLFECGPNVAGGALRTGSAIAGAFRGSRLGVYLGPAGPVFGRSRFRGDLRPGFLNGGNRFGDIARLGYGFNNAGRQVFRGAIGSPGSVVHIHFDLFPISQYGVGGTIRGYRFGFHPFRGLSRSAQ